VRQGAEPADEGAGARGHGGLSRIPRSGLPALAAWLLLVGVIVAIALAGDELMGGTRGGSLAPFGSRVAAPARLVLTQPTAGMTISSRTVMVSGILRDGTTTLLARIWIGGDAEGSAMIPVDAASGRFGGQVTLLVPRESAQAVLELTNASRPDSPYPSIPLTIASSSPVFLDEPGAPFRVWDPLLIVAGTADESVASLRATLSTSDGTLLASVEGAPEPAHLGSTFSLVALLPKLPSPGDALLLVEPVSDGAARDGVRQGVRLATGPRSATGDTQAAITFVGRTLSFSYPRAWYSQRFDYPLVFGPDVETVPFVGSDPMRDACRNHGTDGWGPLTCGWPLDRLSDGGVLLTWWIAAAGPDTPAPDAFGLPRGTPMVVGGMPASLRGARPGICRSLEATETLMVDVFVTGARARTYRLTACLAGQGEALAEAERDVLDVLASLSFRG